MDPYLVSRSPIQLRVEASLAARLPELSQGRALLIDYYSSRRCGVTIGDLSVRFAAPSPRRDYAELEPIGETRVLVAQDLVDVLAAGFELRFGGPAFAQHLALTIDEPERWLDFLGRHPGNRR
jgi:hypothetical protein